MMLIVTIVVVALLILFAFMYWLADKVDKEQEQMRHEQEYYYGSGV